MTVKRGAVQRIPLCSVSGCPAPSSPDYHIPWCGHGLEGQHHHSKKRSQGGTDSFQVFICPTCHNAIDNGYTLEDGVFEFPALNEKRYYIWREMGNERQYLCDKVIDPPFWEDADGDNSISDTRRSDEFDAGVDVPPILAEAGREPLGACGVGTDICANTASSLTFEEWSEKCKSIGTFRHSLGFLIGDLVILGEDTFGEKAWQYLSELGYEDRSIGNMVRVCRAIEPKRRRDTLTYSHHVVVYKLPESEQDEWLEQADGLTVKAFRELVHGPPKPRVKRYSIEELTEHFANWFNTKQIPPEWAGWAEGIGIAVNDFWKYLEAQDD